MADESLFFSPQSKWIQAKDEAPQIVISSRVRLARNLAETPFPNRLLHEQAETVLYKIKNAFSDLYGYRFFKLKDLPKEKQQLLAAKHLISPLLIEQAAIAGFAVNEDESTSAMINEEDHLRLQALLPGLQLTRASKLAFALDDALESKLNFAFDENLGYLSACPTNLGTGLRASVMLHLPALVLSKQAQDVFDSLPRLGLTVRGLYGEGTEARGNLFQVSNQTTLGSSEKDLIKHLEDITNRISLQEQQTRSFLLEKHPGYLEDNIWRSFAILRHARRIGEEEMAERLSLLRLGVDLGMIKKLSGKAVSKLMLAGSTPFIQAQSTQKLSPDGVDTERANLLRKNLSYLKDGDSDE
ncbi:MAG: protein arginine kinase [Clostridia bacterium]|nr:protein arginine kinase [Clostridia bacterium]MDD4798315.1 protein arginine kinase [Clostridia bacterium]